MSSYVLPITAEPAPVGEKEVVLIASGDLREPANTTCWEAQAKSEAALIRAFEAEGIKVHRGHPYDQARRHGFISSQRMGMDVFMGIHPEAPLVVAESVWQYSHNVLSGLLRHRGPILTVANWSGQYPGLVGMLNLNASLHKAGVEFSTLWSVDFTDEFFKKGLHQWLKEKKVIHDQSHIHDLDLAKLPKAERELGAALAKDLKFRRAILGVFDEGCMGMYNAIVEDALLNKAGIFKERLSQSALVAAMQTVSDAEAQEVRTWLDKKGMTFETGKDPVNELTDGQILGQCKMYIAAMRIADSFGCDAIGIQYQQGLKDCVPASDLVEGLLNNADRPPVKSKDGRELYAGQPLPHFNEVDECHAVDAIVSNRVLTAMKFDPATTLHDVRWGEHFKGDGIDDFVWVYMISGAVPASHIDGGYAKASSSRQPPMFFPFGGGTLKGVGKPGEIVWSRVFVEDNALHVDMGRGAVVRLPETETKRRWEATNPEWPMVHVVLHGVSRDQFMARHRANHNTVAYAPSAAEADKLLAAKAAMFAELGVKVHLCGV